MRNRIFIAIFTSCCFISSYAQNCASNFKQAQKCEREKEYKCAAHYYKKVADNCPDYGNAKAKYEECYRKWKESLSTTTQKRPSGGNVPVYQQDSKTIISNKRLYFDENGESLNTNPNITVNYYGKMEIIEDIPNWLSIRQQGSTFIVTCSPNNTSEDRFYEFQIMLGEGMDGISDTIRVYQDSRTAPKRPSRPNPTAQPNTAEPIQENRSITVKVTFETGKATPRFENFGDLLVLLEKNKDIGLQIEVPWCNNQKSEVGFKKYPEALIKKRIKNITDHFGKSGIAKERISCSINYESNTECDCAYVKSVDLSGGSSR